jgi:site-specific recombinase XerD
MFRFAALRHPEHAALIQRVLAIPAKRAERAIVCFLIPEEVDALVASPDRSRFVGRRDHAMLVVVVQTGLRVSELVGLRLGDIHLGRGAHVRCFGKGRKERATPLTRLTVAVLRVYLAERGGASGDPVFPGPNGATLTRDAVRRVVERHTQSAVRSCPSLALKRVGPHVLRHTCAMRLLESGCDLATISLWLGHENPRTSLIYLHAHLALKERALARTAPPNTKPGRYRPPDRVLAFLDQL